jgi:hypothetical protein
MAFMEEFWWNWSVQLAIAIGTIGAAVVALFGGWLRGRLFPPKLVLSLENDKGVKTPAVLAAPDGSARTTVGRWYRLQVRNKRRWSIARQVQVYILRFEEPDPTGEPKITWLGAVAIRWMFQESNPLARDFGYPFNCDLCSVVKDKWVQIHPLIKPHNLETTWREPCLFFVTLQARALEADSNLLRVEIAWDGKWSEDSVEMQHHMTVRVAPARHLPNS